MKFLLTILFLISSPCYARGEYLLNLEKAEFNYAHLDPKTRDPYVPEYTGKWKEKSSVKFRIGLLGGRMYWDNNVHGETVDSGVFQTVGWQWELGIRITNQVSIFHEHHSRHRLEDRPEHRFKGGSQFPVEDSYGIKLILIQETIGKGCVR
jgi:hypothetical protein